jgi:SAM-dependent methyltransferase
MYDAYLGGKDNYEVDRAAVEQVKQVFPTIETCARTNRSFMHRAVEWAARQGIRQFLDIGTGIPTEPNLHQIVQAVTPQARVVYVDNDPLVLAHARALMSGTPEGRTEYIHSDVTAPERILAAPELHETIDLSQPVALSLLALLHFIPDDLGPYRIVRTLLDALAPGSYLIMSHLTPDFDAEMIGKAVAVYHAGGLACQARTRDEFTRFFDGLELVEPGVVVPHRWRPAIEPAQSMDAKVSFYSAVARVP